MKFTLFGSSGFIGSYLCRYLLAAGHEVFTPKRKETIAKGEYLGHVIYAIGMTGNFRQYPFETVDAHVSDLVSNMKDACYDSWLYLSSTRVYGASSRQAKEQEKITLLPGSDGIYDISKLLGESICLSQSNPHVRVTRLSNVYGVGQSPDTFLGSLVNDFSNGRAIVINENEKSSKDYVSIHDVVPILEKIATVGRHRIYNVASGISTTHEDIAKCIRSLTSTTVEFAESAPKRILSSIDNTRIKREFGFNPRKVLDDLGTLFVC